MILLLILIGQFTQAHHYRCRVTLLKSYTFVTENNMELKTIFHLKIIYFYLNYSIKLNIKVNNKYKISITIKN